MMKTKLIDEKSNPTQANQSSDKLLLLIECMSMMNEPGRLQDIAATTGMNPSTALRFISALQRRGYAAQEVDTGRYYLTFKICGLANNVSSRMSIRHIALPFLRSVSQIFGESANLSIESDMSVLYVEVVSGPSKTLMALQRIGNVAPMHCTGVGKLMLLDYSPQKIDQMIALKGLPKFTPQTITTPDALLSELARIRQRGYALDSEECEIGARCVAAPIRDYTGVIVAGISVSGPCTRMTDEHIFSHLPALIDAADQISYRLGWNDPAKSN